jgi:cellulase
MVVLTPWTLRFKVWDRGLLSGTWVEGRWGMTDVYEGANLDISTPTSLKPGKYLLRHEMLNLQTGPPQWFVNCIQLDVSGDGSGLPSDDELVSFPKAYEKVCGRTDLSGSCNPSATFH